MNIYDAAYEQLEENLYLMSRGVRDACLITLRDFTENKLFDSKKEIEEVKELVSHIMHRGYEYKIIRFKITHDDDENDDDAECYMDIFVYKYPHQWEMYKAASVMKEAKDKSANDVGNYILGKLLGYSEASMDEYLRGENVKVSITKVPDDFMNTHSINSIEMFGVKVDFR